MPTRSEALCRSVLYEALAIGFRPAGGEAIERLIGAEAVEALAAAGAFLDAADGTDLETRIRALPEAAGAARGIDLGAIEAERRALFGHTARGPVSPYETEYGDDTLFQKPQEMADLAGFLAAFGLRVDPQGHERVDHVACELEFLAFATRKEAHAIETGDAAMREETRRATRLFLQDHLGRFFPAFAQRLRSADGERFHGSLAALGTAFVASECARFGVATGPETLRLRLPIEDMAPMACGSADGCAPGACPTDERE